MNERKSDASTETETEIESPGQPGGATHEGSSKKPRKSLKNRLLKGGLSMLALRVYSMALMLVLNGALARWMPPDEFASYLVGSNLLIFISLVGMAGLNQSMVKLIAGTKEDSDKRSLLNSLQRCALLATSFSIAVSLVAALLLQSALGKWLNCDPKIILGVLVCSFLVSSHKLLATSMRSVHAIASSSVLEGRSGGPLANTAFLPIAAAFALTGLSASLSFWAFAIALALTLPVGFYLLYRAVNATDINAETTNPNTEVLNWKLLIAASAPFLLTQVLTFFATEFDVWLASAYTNKNDTALFGSARRLILQVLAPMQILTVSASSSIAQLYAREQKEDLQKMLGYAATIGAAATLPVLLVCSLFSPQILALIYGDFYRNGAVVFIIMAVAQSINCMTGQCASLLMMSGRTTVILLIKAVAALWLLGFGSYMAKEHGITGLAIASASTVVLQNLSFWVLAKSMVGYWTHPTLKLKRPKVQLKPKD